MNQDLNPCFVTPGFHINIHTASPLLLIFVFVTFIMVFNNGCVVKGAVRNETKEASGYYPLEIGNIWEYEQISYKDNDQKISKFSTMIVNKKDIGNGMIEFYSQENKEFLIKSNEGVLLPSGCYILKYPLSSGNKWISGNDSYDQRLFKVDDIGFSITIRGETYNDCIKIVETTAFELFAGESVYRALETTRVLAPNVGPVLYDVYDILKSGEKNHLSRCELISFKANILVDTSELSSKKSPRLITKKESFRFPKKYFLGPSLSPDDKWLCYKRNPRGFSSIMKDFDKEIFYTKAGRSDELSIPFCPDNKRKNVRFTYCGGPWSPDGKILVTRYDVDYHDYIGLVDFSREKPRHIESFRIEGLLYWISERTFLYLESGMVMKKKVGEQPEKIGLSNRISKFKVGYNGTIIYTNDNESVYLTSMNNPLKRISLYHNPKKTKLKSLGLSRVYNMSPRGDYAIFSIGKDKQTNKKMDALVDLNKVEIIDTFSIQKFSEAKWSPDGTKVAYLEDTVFEVDRKNPNRKIKPGPHFFILDLKSGERKDYGEEISSNFNWTPDGNHIIYEVIKYLGKQNSSPLYYDGISIMRISDGKNVGRLTAINVYPNSEIYISPSYKYVLWQGLNSNTFFIVENPLKDVMLENNLGRP